MELWSVFTATILWFVFIQCTPCEADEVVNAQEMLVLIHALLRTAIPFVLLSTHSTPFELGHLLEKHRPHTFSSIHRYFLR
jgi:hypothetical protein